LRDDENAQHQTHQLQQHRHIRPARFREQAVIKDTLGNQRRDNAQRCREQHHDNEDGNLRAVGLKQRKDARAEVFDFRRLTVNFPLGFMVRFRHARASRSTTSTHTHSLQVTSKKRWCP
jgi:hypothetical protein